MSSTIEQCQICNNKTLNKVIFLGYLPPVNKMARIGLFPKEEPSFPALLLYCPKCHLVQLGLAVDPTVLFPKEYPYTSSTTKILRENFAELYEECKSILELTKDKLVVDIGSNDGNLLSNFKDHRILGITPEEIGKIAIERGIPTKLSYFDNKVVKDIIEEAGKAYIITATNVFAHIQNVHEVVDNILELLEEDGVFISESHYLMSLLETIQYDTVYHEHLRYYSLTSLKYLLEMHGLEIFHAKKIPTHGGSIRVYACRKGKYKIKESVKELLDYESSRKFTEKLAIFSKLVNFSKLQLYLLLRNIELQKKRICGISAPSRASTLVNYVGLDDNILKYTVETTGSHKIGYYMPGTLIPILDESYLYKDQPDYALVFSWHIAKELMSKIKNKGYKGDFIIPLPIPYIVKNENV